MTYRLGNGLPSTLTPERIKDVLKFAPSQEREFRELLDRDDDPAWTQTGQSNDFYSCLHGLLRTENGRNAYEKARNTFEGSKLKRSGRADFFRRLGNSCLQETLDPDEHDATQAGKSHPDVMETLARANAWERLAEFAWVLGIRSGSGDDIIEALDAHPGIASYLEEVRAGLVPIDDSLKEPASVKEASAEEGEAGKLVDRIKGITADLDAEHLDLAALDDLRGSVDRLIAITKARENQRYETEFQQSRILDWRERHAEALADAMGLDDRLTAFDARVGAGEMARGRLETILDRFETALTVESRFQEIRAACKRAYDEDDFSSVRSHADTLSSIQSERDEVYGNIDAVLSEPLQERGKKKGQEPDTPHGIEQETATAPDVTDDGGTPRDDAPENRKPEPERAAEPAADPSPPRIPEPIAGEEAAVSGDDAAEGEDPRNKTPVGVPAVPERPDGEQTQSAVTSHGPEIPVERIKKAVATAVERHRFGLAYHLALATPEALPSANAIKLIACNYVTSERTSVIADLPDLANKLLHEVKTVPTDEPNPSAWRDHAVLITSAALVPALIAVGGPVAQLLSFLEPRLGVMPSLRTLAKTVADVSMTGIHLPVALLREDDSLEKWSARELYLRHKTMSWLESERKAKLRFQAATRVWRRVLAVWQDKKRVSIGRIFEFLCESTNGIEIDRVSEIVKYWRGNLESEIDRIDRDIRGATSINKIEGAARRDIRSKITEAVSLAESWLLLVEEKPENTSEFHTKKAAILRTIARKNAAESIKEIAALETPLAHRAEDLISRYKAMFEDTADGETVPPMDLNDLLNGDLLASPDISFAISDRLPEAPLDVKLLLHLANQKELDFKHATIERAKRGDFYGAEMSVNIAERGGHLDDDSVNNVRAIVDMERARFQGKYEAGKQITVNRVDAAYARGVVTLKRRDDLFEKLPLDGISEFEKFQPLFDELVRIDREIKDEKGKRTNDIRQLLAEVKNTPKEDRKRVEDALDDGRFQVAEEYIERIGRGETLPKPTTEDHRPFDRFFPDFVEKYMVFRRETPDALARIRHVVENRERAEPIDATRLSVDAARRGGQILEEWTGLCSGQAINKERLSALMGALGFERAGVRGSGGKTIDGGRVYTLQAVPVTDRRIAQLPDFGSRAGGRYRLLTIRGHVTEEAIIREAGARRADLHPPNIALFLNVLDVDSRRALARASKFGRDHPTLVLDEALVAFLAAWPGSRLGAFFDCASAFAFAQPFDPDAAEVPPEMFFGRERERRAILATSGSGEMTHLVYGGRRLGKTALLAEIAREYQTRTPDCLVSLVNLKGTGIGENQPPDDLWKQFKERLAGHGVIGPRTVRRDSIEKDVKKWLGEKPGRRILLLVDEADAFLEADGRQDYRVLEQTKRLMDDTKRRFKVVFAGLHNVQRTARNPNTPFAHLGDPIGIGPMLPEIDGNEIENLIRGPLEALGYRFASTDSVIQIAAETNYYPALAQQFCKELLRELRENGGVDGEDGPPYTIPADAVDRVFDSKETRDRIRNLFSWTIQLDPRYVFLTYLIARESFNNGSPRLRSVSIETIRQTAMKEWPEGFKSDSSFWMFQVLLEEMVGLGILRDVANKNYAIRTRNLRMLIGNDEEIEGQFEEAKNKRPSPTFDPAQFRNTLDEEIPSSLTADQEDQLLSGRNVVGLVFGTRLGGLDRIDSSLVRAVPGVRLHKTDPTSMRPLLHKISRRRQTGVDIVLVDARESRNLGQIEEALVFVARLDAQNRTIRPLFLCGPHAAWAWPTGPRPKPKSDVELRDIWLGPCARDFTRKWLKSREAPAYAELDKPDRSLDPLWPAVAGTAAGKTRPKTIRDAIDIALADEDLVSDVLITPEIGTALRILSTFPGEPMTADDIASLSGDVERDISPEEVIRFFGWAGRLGLLHEDGGAYRLDSTYAAGLASIFSA